MKDLKENKEEKTNILKNKAVLKVTFSNTIFMYLHQNIVLNILKRNTLKNNLVFNSVYSKSGRFNYFKHNYHKDTFIITVI